MWIELTHRMGSPLSLTVSLLRVSNSAVVPNPPKKKTPQYRNLHEVEPWLQDLNRGALIERICGLTERNPRKFIPMPVFSRLPDELERKIFLIAAAEHACPHRYLLIARRVLVW